MKSPGQEFEHRDLCAPSRRTGDLRAIHPLRAGDIRGGFAPFFGLVELERKRATAQVRILLLAEHQSSFLVVGAESSKLRAAELMQ